MCSAIRDISLERLIAIVSGINSLYKGENGLPVITLYFSKTDHFVSQKLVLFHKSLV
jgi:hypothetical protein